MAKKELEKLQGLMDKNAAAIIAADKHKKAMEEKAKEAAEKARTEKISKLKDEIVSLKQSIGIWERKKDESAQSLQEAQLRRRDWLVKHIDNILLRIKELHPELSVMPGRDRIVYDQLTKLKEQLLAVKLNAETSSDKYFETLKEIKNGIVEQKEVMEKNGSIVIFRSEPEKRLFKAFEQCIDGMPDAAVAQGPGHTVYNLQSFAVLQTVGEEYKQAEARLTALQSRHADAVSTLNALTMAADKPEPSKLDPSLFSVQGHSSTPGLLSFLSSPFGFFSNKPSTPTPVSTSTPAPVVSSTAPVKKLPKKLPPPPPKLQPSGPSSGPSGPSSGPSGPSSGPSKIFK